MRLQGLAIDSHAWKPIAPAISTPPTSTAAVGPYLPARALATVASRAEDSRKMPKESWISVIANFAATHQYRNRPMRCWPRAASR
jgi:hypothetical protein